jgi:hypothetical protein
MHPDLEKSHVLNSAFKRLGPDSLDFFKAQKSSKWKFNWKDASYSVDVKAGQKHILRNVSGRVEAGLYRYANFRLSPRRYGPFWLW